MKNNILSNIQLGITAVTVAGTACCGFAEASLTQSKVYGLSGTAASANVDPNNYAFGTYYITEDMVDAVSLTGALNVTASDYFSMDYVISNDTQFNALRTGLTEVPTMEGSTQMVAYTATTLSPLADAYIAGRMTISYTFNEAAHYNQFLADYDTYGIVFNLPGISYLAADTTVILDIKFIDPDTGSTTHWQGGDFVVATATGNGGTNALYIPEPSTATLSLLSLAGLLARRRRKTV